MTTNTSKFNASAPLVKPTTEDESQPSIGNTFKIVEVNNEQFIIRTDIKGTFLVVKIKVMEYMYFKMETLMYKRVVNSLVMENLSLSPEEDR